MEDIWNQYDIGKYHNNTADKYQDEFIRRKPGKAAKGEGAPA